MKHDEAIGKLMHVAHLPEEVTVRIREELKKLLETRHQGDASQLAKALGIHEKSILKVLRGDSKGSLGLAYVMAHATSIPLEDLVGDTLAKMAIKRIREGKSERPKDTVGAPQPPPRSGPVVPRDVGAPGLRVGDVLRDSAALDELLEKIATGKYAPLDVQALRKHTLRLRKQNRALKDVAVTLLFRELGVGQLLTE